MAAITGERRFYEAEFDRPIYAGDPQRYYMLCCGPRTGSWLLCDLLRRSDALGVPAEYFQVHRGAQFFAERFGLAVNGNIDISAYVAALKARRTTANGVFGAKIMYRDMPTLVKERVISTHFPGTKFVHLMRRDIVAQGVSMAIAAQTMDFVKFRDDPSDARRDTGITFDPKVVMKAINHVLTEQMNWKMFFAFHDIDALEVSYETLIGDPQGTCRRIAEHVGVDTDHVFSLANSDIVSQHDELNDDWVKRIKATAVL